MLGRILAGISGSFIRLARREATGAPLGRRTREECLGACSEEQPWHTDVYLGGSSEEKPGRHTAGALNRWGA